jgi:hypothetical protein
MRSNDRTSLKQKGAPDFRCAFPSNSLVLALRRQSFT